MAPPRAKSKPPRGENEAGVLKNRAVKAPKPEPPHRPDLNGPPPVKPKPKPVLNEPQNERKASDSVSNVVISTNPFLNENNLESNEQDSVLSQGCPMKPGMSDKGLPVGGNKKTGPPPIPRRVDLQ